jgi:hypothetical protein
MAQRLTRSTFTGDRVKPGDRGLASLARDQTAKSDSLLGELHRGMLGLFRGSGVAGKGSAGRSTVAGDQVAAGTPFAGQTPVISGSGEVERARRSTIDAYGGFIGAGAGNGAGSTLARHRARVGVRGHALASSERVEHVALYFCSCSTLC